MRRAAILVAWNAFLTVLLMELLLRAVGFSSLRLYRTDELIGESLRPHVSGVYREEGHAHVSINADGFRDRPHSLSKPPDTFRIAVLGDSFVEALQVDVDKTFWSLLAHKLDACRPFGYRKIEVMSFGVSGIGTGPELLLLRHRVWRYDPDLILLAVTLRNDVLNNSKTLEQDPMRPYFVLDGHGNLKPDDSFRDSSEYRRRSSALHEWGRRLADYSRALQFVYWIETRVRNASHAPKDPSLDPENFIYDSRPDRTEEEAWKITERLLAEIQRETRTHGARLVVTLIPSDIQMHPDRRARLAELSRLRAPEIDYPNKRFAAMARRLDLAMVDLTPGLKNYAAERRRMLYGFPGGRLGFGHWNEEGHAAASEILGKYFCSSGRPLEDRRAQ